MLLPIATIIFTGLITVLILFQLSLALGAPWGQYAMGGYFPGRYPPKMRVASLINIGVYLLISMLVLSRAGLIMAELNTVSRSAIWVIAALLGIGVIMNLISRSVWERRVWTPVALVMCLCTIVIALS